MKVSNQIRSKVFKAAWTSLRKGKSKNLSTALKSAWSWAKRTLMNSLKSWVADIRKAKEAALESDTFEAVHNGIVKETEKAYLIAFSNKNKEEITKWVPKSICTITGDHRMVVASWFAVKNLAFQIF